MGHQTGPNFLVAGIQSFVVPEERRRIRQRERVLRRRCPVHRGGGRSRVRRSEFVNKTEQRPARRFGSHFIHGRPTSTGIDRRLVIPLQIVNSTAKLSV